MKATLLLLLLLSLAVSQTSGLSHNVAHSPPEGMTISTAPHFDSNTHLILGHVNSTQYDSALGGWHISAAGWHMWTRHTLVDDKRFPQWPNAVARVRIVINTLADTQSPPMPRIAEHPGLHISALGDAYQARHLAATLFKRTSMADQFITINKSIYLYDKHVHTLDALSLLPDALQPLVAPIAGIGTAQRIDITLSQDKHGFVSAHAQTLTHLVAQNTFLTAQNSTSLSWTTAAGNIKTLKGGTSMSRAIPESWRPRESSDAFVQRTRGFRSLHPQLEIAAHTRKGCSVHIVQVLPRSHFFDPYEIKDAAHYGPVELERPAEAIDAWGSVLSMERAGGNGALTVSLPLHARYRLPPLADTVGYDGDVRGSTHVDVVADPALVLVACDGSSNSAREPEWVRRMTVVPALLPELGIEPPYTAVPIDPQAELRLRTPVGSGSMATAIQLATVVALFAGSGFIVATAKAKVA